jgi:excisionase family DNA binding protein
MTTPRKSQTLARGPRRLTDATLPDLTKPQLLTYADASAVLRLSIPTLERMVANSTLRTVPGLGRSVRFAPAELLRFVEPTEAMTTDAGSTPHDEKIRAHPKSVGTNSSR